MQHIIVEIGRKFFQN